MNTQQNELNKLQRQIEERELLVVKFLKFTSEILTRIGKTTHHEMHKFHTRSNIEVKDFNNFSFFGSFGHSEQGGNDINISFNGQPVMSVYCQSSSFDIKECRVNFFETENDWSIRLHNVIEMKDSHVAKYLSNQKRKKKKDEKVVAESKELAELKVKAQRLGL